MRYYVITESGSVFLTDWFSVENTYIEGDIIIDTLNNIYYDGNGWTKIMEDHL